MRTFATLLLSLTLASIVPSAYAQTPIPVQSDRIAPHPNLTATTRLPGHIPAWARAEADEGPLPGATPLRVTLVLARSPERQAAFTQLLADQQNPASPSYHHWLTPQQLGDQYGPTQHDLDALSAWLASRGLTVTEIAPSRIFLHADAPAATLARAFSTTLHTFRVDGDSLRAPLAEPTIPTAFAPLIQSLTGLADTPLHPMHQHHSAPQANTLHPEYSLSSGTHYVTPGDFATIFDLKPTYAAGYNGAGQKVAIIGRSRVTATDISLFQANTGLPTNLPNTIIPPTGVDPGITGNGDQSEATLDLARVLGTAPGVQADLVVSGSANGLNGIYLAAQYTVQTLLDPVMTISFGSCEVYAGPSQVNLWDTLFAQAASEGISVFVSAADSGAATCDAQFGLVPAYQFRSINYICASSYATCVGGTQFNDTANASAYWSTTNGANLASALSYIPEGAWNEPQTSSGTYVAASGGGGASIYIPKPSWQTGTGVPADGARDVPDISFPAAGHDGYYACYAAGGGDCAANRFEYFYGTSAAAPAMAAVTAILNQKTGSSQGNLNPLLYRTAASTPSAFHDATPASSGVLNCSVTTASICNNTLPSPTSLTGGLVGYALTTGYDQATGLGSLDIANFINANSAPTPTLATGKLTLIESVSTIARAQTVTLTATFTSTASGTPTGTVQFYANAAPIGSPVQLTAAKAVLLSQPFPAAGSFDITAVYSGDTVFAQTTAPGIALTVNGLTATPKITIPFATVGTDSILVSVGSTPTITITIPTATGSPAPTGMARLLYTFNGSSSYIATLPIVNGTGSTSFNFPTVGSATLTAYYLGDSVYSPSTSAPQTITVQRLVSATTVYFYINEIGYGGSESFNLSIYSSVSTTAPAPTGTVQLYSNGAPLGSPFAVSSTNPYSPNELFPTPGKYTITAVYSGDSYWQPSTSPGITETVDSTPAVVAFSTPSASTPYTPTASKSQGIVNPVVVYSGNGYRGLVNLTCTVAYVGTGTASVPPTCALNVSSLTLTSNQANTTFSLTTIAPHAQHGATQSSVRWLATRGVALCALLCLFLPRRPRPLPAGSDLPFQRRTGAVRTISAILLLLAVSTIMSACGSSNSSVTSAGTTTTTPAPAPVAGTTVGNYTVTFTATATGTSTTATTSFALTIN